MRSVCVQTLHDPRTLAGSLAAPDREVSALTHAGAKRRGGLQPAGPVAYRQAARGCLEWTRTGAPPGMHNPFHSWRDTMKTRTILTAALTALVLATTAGCAVTRGQEGVGAYVDDTAITTAVKARFIDNKNVDAAAISVETLNGAVMLSGFAKSRDEKAVAESLVWKVNGVKSVKNEIAVRP